MIDFIEKYEIDVRIFLSKFYYKFLIIYFEFCSISEGKKIDLKNWIIYYFELYKFINLDKYKLMIEECVYYNVVEYDFLIFSKLFDIVLYFVLEEKVKVLKIVLI